MKKNIYLLCILLLFPFIVFSQKDTSNNKWNIFVGVGIGNPEGSFENSKFVYTGAIGFISATEKLKSSIYDIVFMVSYNSNNFNLNEYLNAPSRIGLGGYGGQAISNGEYQETSALVGLSISIPRNSPKFSLNIRFLSGVLYSYYPHMAYYSYTSNPIISNYININSMGGASIPFDIGANIKILIYKKLFILSGIDYLNTVANWRITEQINNGSINTSQFYDDKSSIILLNIIGGVGYEL